VAQRSERSKGNPRWQRYLGLSNELIEPRSRPGFDAISRDEIPREQERVWAFDRYVILPLTIGELVEN
jgi:hypothetical protein